MSKIKKKKRIRTSVEVYDHAILVRGTNSIDRAREALSEHEYVNEIGRLPCRSVSVDGDLCVAFYFKMGPF